MDWDMTVVWLRWPAVVAPSSNADWDSPVESFPGWWTMPRFVPWTRSMRSPFPALRRPATMSGVHRPWLPG